MNSDKKSDSDKLFRVPRKPYPLKKTRQVRKDAFVEWQKAKIAFKGQPKHATEGLLCGYYMATLLSSRSVHSVRQGSATKRKSANILEFVQKELKPQEPSTNISSRTSGLRSGVLEKQKNSQDLSHDTLPSSSQAQEPTLDKQLLVPVGECQNDEKVLDDPNYNPDSVEAAAGFNALPREHQNTSGQSSEELIKFLNFELRVKELLRDIGLAEIGVEKQINDLRKRIAKEEKYLKAKKDNALRQKKFRESLKIKLQNPTENSEEAALLNVRKKVERPRTQDNQLDLHKTITDIAIYCSGAGPGRRSAIISCCRTLGDLYEELLKLGYSLSRTANYYRLLPRNQRTIAGKRHVQTVPVRLYRARTDMHKKHPDEEFAKSTIKSLEELASMLGPKQVAWLSQDDKAKVPLGVPTGNKHASVLMHIEYRVLLPDRDWVIANKHKLTPSVYAGITIESQGFGRPESAGYSGPTYIAVRSGKHSPITPATHSQDLDRLMELDSFKDIIKTDDKKIKPILIITVDGGPDESPRYPKTISFAIEHFKRYDLDAIFIATNAPGRSASNGVERRMASLSKHLATLILKHDQFGSHLDSWGKTIDSELEIRNLEHAGKLLAEIWSEIILDSYPVFAEYKNNEGVPLQPAAADPMWYNKHVRESQYFLQVSKCNDVLCCGKLRSNIRQLLDDGFLRPPYPIKQTREGPILIPSPSECKGATIPSLFSRLAYNDNASMYAGLSKGIPYDLYCPSVLSDLVRRICNRCNTYFASKAAVLVHYRTMHSCIRPKLKLKAKSIISRRQDEVLCVLDEYNTGFEDVQWISTEDVDVTVVLEQTRAEDCTGGAELIRELPKWLAGPWSDEQ